MKFYVYKIKHRLTNQFYIGCRLCKNQKYFGQEYLDFGVLYKTSSKVVSALGFENFDIVYFNTDFESYDACFTHEQKLISEVIGDTQCLNQMCYLGENGHPYKFNNNGNKLTDATKAKISAAKKGKPRKEGSRKPHSAERIAKIKIARNANPSRPHVSVINKLRIPCPHCDREFSPGNFGRHHGDRCKLNIAKVDTSS